MNNEKKTNQEIMAAARQVSLLVTAFEKASDNNDIWLNPSGKTSPRFFPRGAVISPFNSLVLALHSDRNNYRTNEYTLFSESRLRGESVLAGEKGVPFNWYNWNRYVNKNNPNDIISRNDYKNLSPTEKESYKGIKRREIRILFNIEQTTFPVADEQRYNRELSLHGTLNDRGNLLAEERQTRRYINQLISLCKRNLVPIRKDGSGIAHYDPQKDAVYLPDQKNFDNYRDYVQDLLRQIVTATGHPQRLAREGLELNSTLPPSLDAKKQEKLITEIASGVLCLELGMPAKLSEDSKGLVDYWCRELKENPLLIDIVESEVNNAVGIVHKVNQNISIEKNAELHAKRTKEYISENPKNYYIINEIKEIPNKDTKDFVVVLDKSRKNADVILPSGASTEVDNEIPGMNKSRISHALEKMGYENIVFYNPDGALGYSPDDSSFSNKTVSVAKMRNWELIMHTRLDVSDAVSKSSDISFSGIYMTRDDNNKWMLHLKPQNDSAFSIYPDKEDINQYFTTMKNGNGEQFEKLRQQLANKYYRLSLNHPEFKVDIWDKSKTDTSRIENVVFFKTKETENENPKIFCLPTISGIGKPKPREVSQQQWQRMWLANFNPEYKKHLAALIFADVLSESVKENRTTEKAPDLEKNAPTEAKEAGTIQKSPIIEKYNELKEKHPDHLLLFRCGDFYETYKEDAVKASNLLGLTLTKSPNKLDDEGKPYEMAGFPFHALDTYLPKIVRTGQRVAIIDENIWKQFNKNSDHGETQKSDINDSKEQVSKSEKEQVTSRHR